MQHHRTQLGLYGTISLLLVVVTSSVNGVEYDLTGLDSVAAVQSIPVPENPDPAYYLKIHNAYRALIEHEKVPGMPKPYYMPEMEWDAELEDIAKSHAEQCQDDLYDVWGTVATWSKDTNHEPLHDSFNQIDQFLMEPKPYYEKYKQFGQIVTANSRRLGCARNYCKEEGEYITVCKYWGKYKRMYEMPYTGNFSTPNTKPYCGSCPIEFYRDMENDTRRREKDPPEGALRPGPALPPAVVDSTYFLDLHNGYRDWLRNGAPPVKAKAFYMAKMEWDPVLENAARRHAEGCFRNDPFPMADIGTIFEGIALSDPNRQLVHRWFDMYLQGHYFPNRFSGDSSSSLLFVWSIARSVGCWQTRCSPDEGDYTRWKEETIFYPDTTILVCKYSPIFNLNRFYPYIEEFNYTQPVIPPKPTLAPKTPEEPDAEYYVKQHNLYRAKVRNGEVENQPAAMDMPNLTWDNQLYYVARDLTTGCVFSRYFAEDRAGANVGFASEATTDVIHRWFRGHESYVYGNTAYEPTDASSAYTRMVWAKTLKVGCYRQYCVRVTKADKEYYDKYLTTCAYSPVGNAKGELPYVEKD